MIDLRLTLAIVTGKIVAAANKLTGSGATAAPGLYALKIDPNLAKKITGKIKNGSIVITGTNGKTTTSRLVSSILETKHKVIHNRQGSNLLRGIASTLVSNSSITGDPNGNIALWETDEAALPQIINQTSPKTVCFLNLFRDQLDRYGDTDTILTMCQKAFTKPPKTTLVILNADDPGISILEKNVKGRKTFFGIEASSVDLPKISGVSDVNACLNCGKQLVYSANFSSHLGHYHCPNCKLKRPIPDVYAKNLLFSPDFLTRALLNIEGKTLDLGFSLPGLYNVYNTMAAAAIAKTENISNKVIFDKIKNYSPAFGRFQKQEIDGKKIITFLIKNPTGANEVLRTVAKLKKANILVILNDNIADGRDVSWIWDTDWEVIKSSAKNVFISGNRAWDMATRLKYADVKLDNNNIHADINYSIVNALSKLNTNDTLILLPTYTALLEVQSSLYSKKGSAWYEQ